MGELLKASLELAKSYKWLEELIPSTDDDIVKALEPWKDADKTNYLKQNFELHLSDLSRLLDRCLAYRREYNELQASATRQALDYQLFTDLYDSSLALERADWIKGLRETEAKGQGRAAEKFKKTRTQLAGGFAELALTAEQVNKQSAEGEGERIALVHKRWELLKIHQNMLQLQHTEPGHPLNFKEQADRVRAFLLQDIEEAADKANAAYLGVESILRLKAPERKYTEATADPLGKFVMWTRKLIRDTEIVLQREIETELTFTLDLKGSRKGGFAFNPAGDLVGARLKSVGVALTLKDTTISNAPYIVVDNVEISPPNRPTFHLRSVGMLQPNMPVRSYSGQAVANITPSTDDWKFDISAPGHTYTTDNVFDHQLRGIFVQFVYLYHKT